MEIPFVQRYLRTSPRPVEMNPRMPFKEWSGEFARYGKEAAVAIRYFNDIGLLPYLLEAEESLRVMDDMLGLRLRFGEWGKYSKAICRDYIPESLQIQICAYTNVTK